MSDCFDHEGDAWDSLERLYYSDDGFEPRYYNPYPRYVPQVKTCVHCGKSGFHWTMVNGKWILADANGLHDCTPKIELSGQLAGLFRVNK